MDLDFDTEVYSPTQIEAVVAETGVQIQSVTGKHLLCMCPFHNNTYSPAFLVNRSSGKWYCLNASCAQTGDLVSLVMKTQDLDYFKAYRFVLDRRSSLSDVLSSVLGHDAEPEFTQFPQEPVERMQSDFILSRRAIEYMESRGFTTQTMLDFGLGYSKKQDMVITPMHDPSGMLVGFIGRSIEDKQFKNTVNLPTSKTLFNFHRAKKHGSKVIIVESSYDAMRITQAGYPNVVALLGGYLSPAHIRLLSQTFDEVVIMTDWDKLMKLKNCQVCNGNCHGHNPGRDLAKRIVESLPNTRIWWAAYDDSTVYPHGAKDASDMSDEEIRTCLKGAISNFEYQTWNPEGLQLTA